MIKVLLAAALISVETTVGLAIESQHSAALVEVNVFEADDCCHDDDCHDDCPGDAPVETDPFLCGMEGSDIYGPEVLLDATTISQYCVPTDC